MLVLLEDSFLECVLEMLPNPMQRAVLYLQVLTMVVLVSRFFFLRSSRFVLRSLRFGQG